MLAAVPDVRATEDDEYIVAVAGSSLSSEITKRGFFCAGVKMKSVI